MMQYNKQYAKTLFEVCEKADCISIIQNQLYSVSYLFNKVPVFRLVLITKRIDNQNKINIIKNTLIKFNPLIVEFLSIIINNNQINNLLNIISKFNRLVNLRSDLKKIDMIISPSDFGFHNVIERNKKLYFFDFEYSR